MCALEIYLFIIINIITKFTSQPKAELRDLQISKILQLKYVTFNKQFEKSLDLLKSIIKLSRIYIQLKG
jgi:hypothetical protein